MNLVAYLKIQKNIYELFSRIKKEWRKIERQKFLDITWNLLIDLDLWLLINLLNLTPCRSKIRGENVVIENATFFYMKNLKILF